MTVVRCWACGNHFDLVSEASWCSGHAEHESPDPASPLITGHCRECPHCHAALHQKPGFDLLPRRTPTIMEFNVGFSWILASVPSDGEERIE